jgi:hypothetical protein
MTTTAGIEVEYHEEPGPMYAYVAAIQRTSICLEAIRSVGTVGTAPGAVARLRSERLEPVDLQEGASA